MELKTILGNMDYNMDKVYYQKIQDAEESRSQPEISKEKIKSLKTTRLAQRPHKEHIDGQPQKGIWMKRRIHPIHKAEPARQMVFMTILVLKAR